MAKNVDCETGLYTLILINLTLGLLMFSSFCLFMSETGYQGEMYHTSCDHMMTPGLTPFAWILFRIIVASFTTGFPATVAKMIEV